MSRYPSQRALKDLVAELIARDDQVLQARAYQALGALLTTTVV